MTPTERGYFELQLDAIDENQRYAFRLNGGPDRPDPCSLWQPDGVHGFSAVTSPRAFAWTDAEWRGVSRHQLALYELHVGAFTPAGTFDAIIPRLPDLKQLGITALELMPIAQFPGTRNWGYDGVGLYSAQNSYGGPQGLLRLVDACHAAGLAIFLDVVYNHLGPEGNYLREFGPYFTDRYKTPWGDAVNYDGPGCDGVRDFVLDNARMWLEEFHFDGLRLDAVHAIYDTGARQILREIQRVADEVAAVSQRLTHVIAESDLNDPKLLISPGQGGLGLDAQWADDFHHALHAFLTGERSGYYADFGDIRQVREAFQSPYLYAGHFSPHRNRTHGAPVPAELSGDRFVVCLQNHDQVGNRARGDRLATLLASPAQQRLAASMLLFSPYLPLLFMGEEYGEENPFPFFCSFTDPQLVQAVREGRKREFAEFAEQGPIPDPQAAETFASARLRWQWPEGSVPGGLRRLYADLLEARRVWPALRDFRDRSAELLPSENDATVLRLTRGSQADSLAVYFNLTSLAQPLERPACPMVYSSESKRYAGSRQTKEADSLLPYECAAFGAGTRSPFGLVF